jgi:hypothetical protein
LSEVYRQYVPQQKRVKGDEGLISAAQGFFDDWFVRQNFESATGYFSPQCHQCVNLYLGEGEREARNWAEGRLKLLNGMKNVSGVIGRKSAVGEAIRGVTPAHPIPKLVTHSQEQAYTLVSVPDEIAKTFECRSQVKGVNAAQKLGAPGVYGDYYGAIFELKAGGTPAALKLLWPRGSGQWKIIAYSIEVP